MCDMMRKWHGRTFLLLKWVRTCPVSMLMRCSIPCTVPTTISSSSELRTKQVGSEEKVDTSLLWWNTSFLYISTESNTQRISWTLLHTYLGLWWMSLSLFNHSTTRGPPFPIRPCAQVWAEVWGGSLRACWTKRAGQEESRRLWRFMKLRQWTENTEKLLWRGNKTRLAGKCELCIFKALTWWRRRFLVIY